MWHRRFGLHSAGDCKQAEKEEKEEQAKERAAAMKEREDKLRAAAMGKPKKGGKKK